MALQIMKTITGAVLSQEEKVKESVYLNNIYVNEDIVSSLHVQMKLAQFDLICKDPEWLENGTRILGLDVHGEQRTLQWRRGIAVPEVPDVLIRRAIFPSVVGSWHIYQYADGFMWWQAL